MKIIQLLLICLFLFGCISPNSNINYYLLDSPNADRPAKLELTPENSFVLEPIQLADYLKKINLVMKIKHNQLYYSQQDVWAENLQTGIYKALLSGVNIQATQSQLFSNTTPGAKQVSKRLWVKFDYFMPTDQSTVMASGQYWLIDGIHLDKSLAGHNFHYVLELHQDGYAHAAEQLSALLGKLSQDIAQQMQPN